MPFHRQKLCCISRKSKPAPCRASSSGGSSKFPTSCSSCCRTDKTSRSRGTSGKTAWPQMEYLWEGRQLNDWLRSLACWPRCWGCTQLCQQSPPWSRRKFKVISQNLKNWNHTLTPAKTSSRAELAFSTPRTLGRHITRNFFSILQLCMSAT